MWRSPPCTLAEGFAVVVFSPAAASPLVVAPAPAPAATAAPAVAATVVVVAAAAAVVGPAFLSPPHDPCLYWGCLWG